MCAFQSELATSPVRSSFLYCFIKRLNLHQINWACIRWWDGIHREEGNLMSVEYSSTWFINLKFDYFITWSLCITLETGRPSISLSLSLSITLFVFHLHERVDKNTYPCETVTSCLKDHYLVEESIFIIKKQRSRLIALK